MIIPLPTDIPIVNKDGKMRIPFILFMNSVVSSSAVSSVMTGSGSPEGVVSAEATRLYMDTAGLAGSVLYIKQLDDIGGDTTQGWILV